MVVAHNLLAANANRQFGIITNNKKKSTEKLSSGYRINRASDDAAGLSISEKLRYQIRGLDRGQKNTMDGVSWCQIGDGALQEIEDMVQRIRELSVQASNDTNTQQDRDAIDSEVRALRQEINATADHAMFNTQHIFYSKDSSFGVMGVPNDLQVYTSNTSIPASPDTTTDNYGGVIFDGNRIPWNSIRHNMVDRTDTPDTFNSGTYQWADPNSSRHFTISVDKNDTALPVYTRQIDIAADANGIHVDGYLVSWDQVKDEDGVSMSDATKHDGVWTFDYKGAKVAFYLSAIEDMSDVYREIGDPHIGRTSFAWEVPYTGVSSEQAVDASTNRTVTVTNKMQQTLYNNALLYTVKADQDGLSLVDSHGNDVPNSQTTWKEFFETNKTNWNDWINGTAIDVKKDFVFNFTDIEGGSHDTDLAFTFSLSDITGLDDVIEGLNGMPIYGNTITNYQAVDSPTNQANHVSVFSSTHVSYVDERTLGRDFDQKQITDMSTGNFSYTVDAVTHQVIAQVDFQGTNNVRMTGSFENVQSKADITNQLMDGVKDYIESIIAAKTEQLMTGTLPNIKDYHTSLKANLHSGNGSLLSSTIVYDHSHLINDIDVQMAISNTGAYVKKPNGTYRKYVAAIDGVPGSSVDRYDLTVSYAGVSGIDNVLAKHQTKVLDSTVGSAINTANGAKVQLDAMDYTYATTYANENPNSANRSLFKSVVVKKPLNSGIHIQNSSNVGDAIIIPRFAMNTVELGIFGVNTKTYEDAQMAIEACDYAISVVNECRGIFGSVQNRLEHTINNSANAEENQQAAESRIRDTDMAKEMVNYSKHNILAQVGQAMMSQANQSTQGVLSLLK